MNSMCNQKPARSNKVLNHETHEKHEKRQQSVLTGLPFFSCFSWLKTLISAHRVSNVIAIVVVLVVTNYPAQAQKAANAEPLQPRTLTLGKGEATLKSVVAELAKQTGMDVDITGLDPQLPIKATFNKTTFWQVVDILADQTGSRVELGLRGKPVTLVKQSKPMKVPSATDGPFRIAATTVESRIDLQTGVIIYNLTLEVAWETRLPVYAVDSQPRISKGEDDAGRPLTVKPVRGRVPVSSAHATLRFNIAGLSRSSKQIALLQGDLKVIAADELLRFDFDDAAKPISKTQKGIVVDLKKFDKEGNYWIADLRLHYPDTSASFESFETYWLSRNRFTLISPDGKSKFTTDDVEINGSSLRYRLKETNKFNPQNLNGWKLEYETPGVMREIPVKFELKGIALP